MFKSCVFLNEISRKLLFFKILRFTVFAVSWSIFGLFLPNLPFWNSQNVYFLGKKIFFQYHRKWQCSNKNRQSTFFLLRLYIANKVMPFPAASMGQNDLILKRGNFWLFSVTSVPIFSHRQVVWGPFYNILGGEAYENHVDNGHGRREGGLLNVHINT